MGPGLHCLGDLQAETSLVQWRATVMELLYALLAWFIGLSLAAPVSLPGDRVHGRSGSTPLGEQGEAEKEELEIRQKKTEHLFDQLHGYDIVVPSLVDHQGDFITYDVTHHSAHVRMRRSLIPNNNNSIPLPTSKQNFVYFKLSAFGIDFHFNLTRNQKLVSPTYVVEYWNQDKVDKSHNFIRHCHYVGHIHTREESSMVALSNCHGLHGVFSTESEEYLVEPLWNDTHNLHTEGQFHVVYKRSDIKTKHKDKESPCGVDDANTSLPHWWLPRSPWTFNQTLKPHHYGYHHKDKWRSRRRKRSLSIERHVETLVVVDKMMVGYHGKQHIEPYVLTVMNIVAKLYHGASIGNAINIVVTRLVLLTEDQSKLEIGHHADKSLESFCRWQQRINPTENSVHTKDQGVAHHDNAVLLTRYDICTYKNQPCGTLGLAPVAGMCEPDRSCSINEDIGLASAFTVAHEIGHNFGMQHDGSGNPCGTPGHEPARIMAAQLTKHTEPFSWSSCSREYITGFLDSGRGKCLANMPPEMDFEFGAEMPGQTNDADQQCQLQYHSKSFHCENDEEKEKVEMCRELFCMNALDQCVTNSIPPAYGTTCISKSFKKGWCQRGKCVKFGWQPEVVHGKWGEWSKWGRCTRTCGGGVASSLRRCDNPKPDNGGKYCIGERKRYKSCNIHDCPINSTNFRELQCAKYNGVSFRGKYYKWMPFSGAGQVKPCALNCLAVGFNFYTERSTKVIDGTRCYPDRLDVCINGECKYVGCDRLLGSNAVEDKCRVCGGDASTCDTKSGHFKKVLAEEDDSYKEVFRIPQGAVHIKVVETTLSRNYLALKSATDDKYYINGAWTIDWPRKFEVASTIFHYERPKDKPESLFALGPTSQDLYVMILLQEKKAGIKYQYNIPVTVANGTQNFSDYTWQFTSWSECTVPCAKGTSKSASVCVRNEDRTIVEDKYCLPVVKPHDKLKYCNEEPCPPEWLIGKWSECSRTCDGGEKTRSVHCVRRMELDQLEEMDHKDCLTKRPRSRHKCNQEKCPPHWATDGWTSCQPSCGPGVQERNVYCMSSGGRLRDHHCEKTKRPSSSRKCHNKPCPPPSWIVGEWGECSAKCGKGQQVRAVKCRTHTGKRGDGCDSDSKPNVVQQCDGPCEPVVQDCKDVNKVAYCPLVLKFKFCNRSYFRQMCCKTCKNAGFE